MATPDPTTTDPTTPDPSAPTPPDSTLQPDDGTAPLSSLQFFCGTCGQQILPTTFEENQELARPQTRYTYSCSKCASATGSGGAAFDLLVFHDTRQTEV